MAIAGIGTDLCKISRIERALQRFGSRFAEKVLIEGELARFRSHRDPASFLAKRFAAKEAFSKAMGTGMKYPVHWRNLVVSNERSGKPTLGFRGPLLSLVQERGITSVHLSLTDEPDFVMAFVVLESS